MRLSPECRLIGAFLAAAAALIIAAWFAISSGRAYVAAEDRIDQLTQASHVLSELSSTTGAPGRDDDRNAMTKRVSDVVARIRLEREAARHHRDAVERASAMLGALTVAFLCFACAALLHALRREQRLRVEMSEESNHDPLTGLPNLRYFAEWLSCAIAHGRRQGTHVGVLFIDVNGCAAVSELHGEHTADAMLIEIARRFRAVSRQGDLFARLGTTEFALATPNALDGRQLGLLAQRLRDQLNDAALPPIADTPIGASIGIAFFPEDADDSAGVMAAANAAMYAARRAGKNHVAFNALAA
jgi:diguanylate cyclase (GGDEF)-like protein